MRKLIITVMALVLTIASHAAALDLDHIRERYDKAVTDEQLCRSLIAELSKKNEHAVYLGYLGALQTIWATHVKSPWAKLSTFNQGKSNIEQAVAAEPNNIELRFIRLSIQKNCPRFLGYRGRIEEDRLFIKNNLQQVRSETLRKMCTALI